MFGRKVRTLFDALCPRKTRETGEENQSEKFTANVALNVFLAVETLYLSETTQRIARVRESYSDEGNVVYKVDVGGTVWIRHANQKRHCVLLDIIQERKMNLPSDILLETVEMQPENGPTGANIDLNPSPLQRGTGRRIPVKRLQMNPRLRIYDISPKKESVGTRPDMRGE
ncbi:hypothetical protein CSKR_110180 [Clonorchis sinensis]|uniref:Uncharacterized protein n=1 Tax=Clonorchis sinensis TaxID=79923 RepID=A0A3R7CVD7_CLOSI|nr:hypothetical protein CSKR_110180 [Clonorchis sinensis]